MFLSAFQYNYNVTTETGRERLLTEKSQLQIEKNQLQFKENLLLSEKNQMNSSSAGVTKEDIKEHVKEGLREFDLEKKEKSIVLSAITDTKLHHLLSILQFKVIEAAPETVRLKTASDESFFPFDWRERREDDSNVMKEAAIHLQTQLSNFGVSFGEFGYKLCDVHSRNTMLNVQHSKFSLKGGTDLIIVPYRTCESYGSGELCVMFELKTKVATDVGFEKFEKQAIAETIAARYLSDQPGVLVVLTDLVENVAMYEFSYEEETNSFSILRYKDVSLDSMALKVKDFLEHKTIPNATYIPPADISSASERERGIVQFKRQKVEHFTSLALEQLQDMMMDPAEWTIKERAQLVANLYMSIEEPAPMPISVQYAMYS